MVLHKVQTDQLRSRCSIQFYVLPVCVTSNPSLFAVLIICLLIVSALRTITNRTTPLTIFPMPAYTAGVLGSNCRGAEFEAIRFLRGSRQGEVYFDVLGSGQYSEWHTVYNFTSAVNLIRNELGEA